MPDIVGDADTDLLAAEYVLGTLDTNERSQARVLLGIDHGFSGMVKVWERRLGELHVMVEPVEPAAKLWDRIKAKLADPASVQIVPPTPAVLVMPPPAPDSKPAAAPESQPAAALESQPAALESEPADVAATETAAPAAAPDPSVQFDLTAVIAQQKESAPLPGAPDAAATLDAPATPEVAEVLERPAPRATSERRRVVVERSAPSPRSWQVATLLLALVAIGLAGLLAAMKFAPEKVPPAVRQVLLPTRLLGPALPSGPVRRPAPPGSQFDE